MKGVSIDVPVVGVQRFAHRQYDFLQTSVKLEYIVQGWNIEVAEGISERDDENRKQNVI